MFMEQENKHTCWTVSVSVVIHFWTLYWNLNHIQCVFELKIDSLQYYTHFGLIFQLFEHVMSIGDQNYRTFF